MKQIQRKGRSAQRGFSLVELGVGLLVIGLLTLGALTYWRTAGQKQVAVAERDLQTQAQQAMVGFAHANFRLPCPAVDRNGVEDCGLPATPNQIGFLPWRTLLLPDGAAAQFKYGVYRASNVAGNLDQDLAVAKDRVWPLRFYTGTKTATDQVPVDTPSVNLPDLCLAVNLASDMPAPTGALAVKEGTTVTRRSMAFVIAAPGFLDADGDGDRFDGLNHTANNALPTFEASNRVMTDTYDDRVLAMDLDTLFAQLNCGQALSAIHHSHFNAALGAAFMKQGMEDYKIQLDVQVRMAEAGVASATAGTFSAAAGLANAVAALANATAFTVITYGSTAGLIAAATAAVVINTAAVVASAGPLTTSSLILVEAKDRVTTAQGMIPTSAALATSVEANAKNADALGF